MTNETSLFICKYCKTKYTEPHEICKMCGAPMGTIESIPNDGQIEATQPEKITGITGKIIIEIGLFNRAFASMLGILIAMLPALSIHKITELTKNPETVPLFIAIMTLYPYLSYNLFHIALQDKIEFKVELSKIEFKKSKSDNK